MPKIIFEMTGNVPKNEDRGIKFKKDFVKWAERFGWRHGVLDGWPTPNYLVASKEGTIKCQKAKQYGVPIISYEEALNKMEGIELKMQLI